MAPIRCLSLAVGVAVGAAPLSSQIPIAAITVSATVLPRPLTLLGASLTPIAGELQVRLDGCAGGGLSVDGHSTGGMRRIARQVLAASVPCESSRMITFRLPPASAGVYEYVVTLDQSESQLSPAFTQFVVPAAVLNPRTALGH
jgi:hypothetical protein